MKKFKYFIVVLMLIMLIVPSASVHAEKGENPGEYFAYGENAPEYRVKVVPHNPDYIAEFVAGLKLSDYRPGGGVFYNYDVVTTDVEWVNPEYTIIPGIQTISVKANHNGKELVFSFEIEAEETIEEFNTSLTADKVLLESRTAYDINLNNKVSGSKYKWTSSNSKVAKVNSKNGLVTAVSEGEATITCVITLPDGTKQTLKSIITVGYDDNAPLLTETILDLSVGDKFDINVENKIAKSKYRWVSSDRRVVTVNTSNGIVTAKSSGNAYVTCTITTPDNQIIVLRCDINVE